MIIDQQQVGSSKLIIKARRSLFVLLVAGVTCLCYVTLSAAGEMNEFKSLGNKQSVCLSRISVILSCEKCVCIWNINTNLVLDTQSSERS